MESAVTANISADAENTKEILVATPRTNVNVTIQQIIVIEDVMTKKRISAKTIVMTIVLEETLITVIHRAHEQPLGRITPTIIAMIATIAMILADVKKSKSNISDSKVLNLYN